MEAETGAWIETLTWWALGLGVASFVLWLPALFTGDSPRFADTIERGIHSAFGPVLRWTGWKWEAPLLWLGIWLTAVSLVVLEWIHFDEFEGMLLYGFAFVFFGLIWMSAWAPGAWDVASMVLGAIGLWAGSFLAPVLLRVSLGTLHWFPYGCPDCAGSDDHRMALLRFSRRLDDYAHRCDKGSRWRVLREGSDYRWRRHGARAKPSAGVEFTVRNCDRCRARRGVYEEPARGVVRCCCGAD